MLPEPAFDASLEATLRAIAGWMHEAKSVVAFTGAGVSTESGIPDFRSPGGIWSQAKPVYYQEFVSSATARYEYWRQKAIAHRDFRDSRPNPGHLVLADWERSGRLRGVITQNIDGMHQLAGSRQVLEIHGTARQIACLDCGARFDADGLVDVFLQTDAVPACERCGGLLKHATISFGQALDEDVWTEAARWSRWSDVMLAIGSSLVVHPAAGLPSMAKAAGAKLVIINRDPTPLDGQADAVLRCGIGDTLEKLARAIQETAGG